MLLDEAAWQRLQSQFGGGPCIRRPIIQDSRDTCKRLRVAVYPMQIQVQLQDGSDTSRDLDKSGGLTLEMDRDATLYDLKRNACDAFKVRSCFFAYWRQTTATTCVLLSRCVKKSCSHFPVPSACLLQRYTPHLQVHNLLEVTKRHFTR